MRLLARRSLKTACFHRPQSQKPITRSTCKAAAPGSTKQNSDHLEKISRETQMSHSMASKAIVWGRADPPQPDIPLTIWGVGSTRALRVHWMLAELGVPYISYRIQSRTGETMDPKYLKLNPRHK